VKLDPQTIRQRMIKSYADGYARAGKHVPTRDIERLVIADCEMVDNAKAAGDIADETKPKQKKPAPHRRPDPLKDALTETGTRLNVGDIGANKNVVRTKVMHANPMATSERWGYAAGRIQRILEGVRKDTSSLVVAVEDAELGILATEYANLWGDFMTRYQAPPLSGNDRNPFRGMSDRDAARKFQRLTEDICDRSTGRLGPWHNGVSAGGFARNKG
jgi:hypothetical protein